MREALQSGVQTVVAAAIGAFAALKTDGSVVTWGLAEHGSDSYDVRAQLTDGVQQITAGEEAFAAIKSDGSVVTWGDPWGGG